MESKAENFPQFCKLMTSVAENQLNFHRPAYYKASRDTYEKIMTCYSDPRQTNEETDACAETHRQRMNEL